MRIKFIKPAHAHCDLMCGVYDPAQARIEAQSVLNAVKKYHDSDDEVFRARAIAIKEERAEEVKRHLWVLWTDYFKPEHAEAHPELHDLIWRATKAAGQAKKTVELSDAEDLINLVDQVGELFATTKDNYNYSAVVKNLS
ncbi:TPA: superoxide dismutase, Ni [Candidatus Saccharibacteria bacterium]|nr:superoxide dismutase, Ni [Candidatus Saccharibacteria bacterium]HIO87498.1 superoxide dismutase, Ni [Candidatus Saccharibacteria bacterium]